MTTLITVQTNDGIKGRCDERCYNATGKVCKCCCGGKNHGVGLKQAKENTRDMLPDEIRENIDTPEKQVKSVRIENDVYQDEMFGDDERSGVDDNPGNH